MVLKHASHQDDTKTKFIFIFFPILFIDFKKNTD